MNSICKKVFLFKEVLISESSLRKAKVALKTDGNSNKSRNNGIAIIMDALYQSEELANMSLSGNACPSMPGSKPKPAISKEVLNEIIGTLLSTKPLFFMHQIVNHFLLRFHGKILGSSIQRIYSDRAAS